MTKKLATLLALLLSCSLVHAADQADLLKEIAQQISQHQWTQVAFKQTKQMQALKKPFVSKGTIQMAQNGAIVWQVDSPYKIKYALSQEAIIETNAKGESKTISHGNAAVMMQINRLLTSMLNADQAQLEQQFTIQTSGSVQNWKIQLSPKTAQFKQFITEILLTGRTNVESIHIDESNGDRTDIQFSPLEQAAIKSPEAH